MQSHATRRVRVESVSFLLLAAALAFASGRAHALDATGTRAVPTYEAVGLYWSSPGATAAGGCEVQYRVSGAASWSQALTMWYDARNTECRGSIVGLTPGTSYDVQLNLPGQPAAKALTFSTWSNTQPVSQTITVPSGSATLNISAGGSASGYVVYDGGGSAVLDAQNGADYNVTINASYVIVRRLTLKGARIHGVLISKDVHDVIIEDNDISGWGRTRDGTWGADMDSGIRAVCVNQELTRVTVQRNKVHDPRYPTNSWSVAHPAGAQGLTFSYCGGQNVYRWNEFDGGANHFNDCMGGEDNYSTNGWPYADSDVYGNICQNAWDDGLEIEGADRNVRVWGNYLNNTGTGIASTVDSVGPLYIFRNVWNRNRFYQNATCNTDEHQPLFKSGSDSSLGDGRRYLFHNTMLQATQSGCSYGLGGGAGIGGTGSTQLVNNTVSMNNIYHLFKQGGALYQVGVNNTFQNDMFDGTYGAAIVNGINAAPVYAAGNGWQSESGGQYALASGTPGYDQGVRIPNFNDAFVGAAPDVGAAEAGAPAMRFGLAAASSSGGGSPPPPPPPPPSQVAPSATLVASAYAITQGQTVTFTATVIGSGAMPTGTVTFKDGSTAMSGCASLALASGTATCSTAGLSVGSHSITASYSGDASYLAAVAGPITEAVQRKHGKK